MGSFSSHILFTFLCVFCSITDIISQESSIETYEYSYVTRGGKTIQENTKVYVTEQSHEVHNGYRWVAGRYYLIFIVSRKGKFILQTYSDDGKEINGAYSDYTLIRNKYFVKKLRISEGVSHIIFHSYTTKSRIILSKHPIL